MKISIVKMALLFPFLLFLDWIIMVIAGGFASMCGADEHFFCTIYCYFGISLLVMTFIVIAVIIIKQYFHLNERVQA